MPTTITRYKCNKCGGEYDTQAKASTCESSHPGTISVAAASQTYSEYSIMPNRLAVSHSNKTYYYYLHT